MTRILVIMPVRPPFEIVYAPAVLDHLRAVPRRHHSLLRGELERQLGFEPAVPTRNRKPLRGPNALGAEWELRCGPENGLRVFYEVDHDARRVSVLAIGVKERERLLIGNEEVQL
ncbi:MAG: type II toxin-antitoxin system RelE family toxin [Candidatus Rokuibacteriota bacterium]